MYLLGPGSSGFVQKKTIATHIKHNLAARELVLGSSLIWTEVDPSWDLNMLLGASGCMNLLWDVVFEVKHESRGPKILGYRSNWFHTVCFSSVLPPFFFISNLCCRSNKYLVLPVSSLASFFLQLYHGILLRQHFCSAVDGIPTKTHYASDIRLCSP